MPNENLIPRIERLEKDTEKNENDIRQLFINDQRHTGEIDTLSKSAANASDTEKKINTLQLTISNMKLVQSAFLWVATLVASSTITMLITMFVGGKE